jgi:hypothetical protein
MAVIIDGEEVRDTIIEAVARVTDGKAMEQRGCDGRQEAACRGRMRT